LNERINEFGIPLDRPLLAGAIKAAQRTEEKIKAEFRAITRLSPDQTKKLLTWLQDGGADIANLREGTLKKALAGELPPKVKRAIELRLAHAQASAKKLISLDGNCDDDDNRCRGSFRYHGAHTGRFTSHGVQTQNMKKSESKDLGAVIAAVHVGAELPLSALGDLPRNPGIISSPQTIPASRA
jgi:DNA polymerase